MKTDNVTMLEKLCSFTSSLRTRRLTSLNLHDTPCNKEFMPLCPFNSNRRIKIYTLYVLYKNSLLHLF